ncbi:MAG: hypothetical protein OXC10_19435 [Rhodospirillaceae bacterium]|nr:hypothetical protein [Rhodospirillaceae bacterium]
MTEQILDYVTLAGIAGILLLLWNLHWDMAAVRERLARLEGTVETLRASLLDGLYRKSAD